MHSPSDNPAHSSFGNPKVNGIAAKPEKRNEKKEGKDGCAPPIETNPSAIRKLTGIDPRHSRLRLLLLPSGPDKVHERLLRGGRAERTASGPSSFRGDSAPHKADFGYRAPLTPRLAQPTEEYIESRRIFKNNFEGVFTAALAGRFIHLITGSGGIFANGKARGLLNFFRPFPRRPGDFVDGKAPFPRRNRKSSAPGSIAVDISNGLA